MLLALKENDYISALPQTSAICPHCKEPVLSKCGNIKIWHWAHKVAECKYNIEPETEWHLEWKQRALDNGLVIEYRVDEHIADIFNPVSKTIVKVQHSPICSEEILLRTVYYKNRGYKINWVFDFRNKKDHFYFKPLETDEPIYSFKQSWQKKSLNMLFREDCKPFLANMFLHFGELNLPDDFRPNALFRVSKKYDSGNGWGRDVGINSPFELEGLIRNLK